jgi:hypothetical protein
VVGGMEGEGEYSLGVSAFVDGPGLDASTFLSDKDDFGGAGGPVW